MTMTPQFAQCTQADLVHLIESYRYVLQGDLPSSAPLFRGSLTKRSADPQRSPAEKVEAERALAALYQPAYGSASAQEHSNRVLGGYRATLANPNVSEAAKAHARAMLEQAGADVRTQKERNNTEGGRAGVKNPDSHLARQLGGYKSALKSEFLCC
jgi:Conidiation protein 6